MRGLDTGYPEIVKVIQATDRSEYLPKLDLIRYFAILPYTDAKLRDALSFPPTKPSPPTPYTAEALGFLYCSHYSESLIKLAFSSYPVVRMGCYNLLDE